MNKIIEKINKNEMKNEMKNKIKNKVYDIRGKEIKVGDTIIWHNFVWESSNTGDAFGAEPQNSRPFEEVYIEDKVSSVVEYLGALCVEVKHKESLNLPPDNISLKEIIEASPKRFDEFIGWRSKEKIDTFLSDSVFDDKKATEQEARETLTKFEIIKTNK